MRRRCTTVSCEETWCQRQMPEGPEPPAPHKEDLDQALAARHVPLLNVQTLVNGASRAPMQRRVEQSLEKFVFEAGIQG
jgi:hypothetical protein